MADKSRALSRATPAFFVLIWSTGFIVARFGMPYAPPLTFLSLRFAASALCFGVWSGLSRAAWPRGRAQWLHLGVTGVLMHAAYLGGVWSAVKAGIGAGTVALIAGLQPVLTALWINMTASGEHRITPRQWSGLSLGFVGLTLVVWRKLSAGEITAFRLGLAVMGLLCITVGTLYQKRFVAQCDVRTANTVQLCAAVLALAPLALLESEGIAMDPHFIAAMAWSVLVLTLGGSSLLFLMIQRGAATEVTSLLYLVPPCTAVMAWLLFGESLTGATFLGLMFTAAGVALVVRAGGKSGRERRS